MSSAPYPQPIALKDLPPGAHAVQVYASDDLLIERLADYVGQALAEDDAAVIIATKAHRRALAKQLGARDFDLTAAARTGRYISVDAAETLSQLLVNGWPNAVLFSNCIGTLLGRAAAAGLDGKRPRVVAYGEMVSVLWDRGEYEAAVQVEKLWNTLSRTHAFALCCSYTAHAANGAPDAFRAVLAEHSHVLSE